MRRTVSQVNDPMMPSSTAMSSASHQWKRQASTRPQTTPMGVMTNNNGFAIFMREEVVSGRGCRDFAGEYSRPPNYPHNPDNPCLTPLEDVPRQVFVLG